MTLADLLTITRLILVPLFLMAFLRGQYQVALVFFAVAGGTDLIDGTVARLLKRQTRLGATLDPIADKALMAATFACLWSAHIVPGWFFILVLSRDLMILGGLGYLKWRRIETTLKPFWSSKWATLFQIGTGVFGMIGFLEPRWNLFGWPLTSLMHGCILIATTLIVISGLQYLKRGLRILQQV